MLHGHYAATNIHQLMQSECIGSKPEFMSLQVSPPMIGLCLGKTAVTYNTIEGTRSGEDLNAAMFGDDMGNTSMTFPHQRVDTRLTNVVCWNFMRLGEPCQA